MLELLVRTAGDGERTTTVPALPAVAGTDPDLPIVLRDPAASRRQFVLEERAVGIVLRDLGSENGTAVNGEYVSQVRLAAGDEIRVGKETLVVTLLPAIRPPAAVPVPAPALAAVTAAGTAAPESEGGPRISPSTRPGRVRRRRSGPLAPLLVLLVAALGLGGGLVYLTRSRPGRHAPPQRSAFPVASRAQPVPSPTPAPAIGTTSESKAGLPPPYVPPSHAAAKKTPEPSGIGTSRPPKGGSEKGTGKKAGHPSPVAANEKSAQKAAEAARRKAAEEAARKAAERKREKIESKARASLAKILAELPSHLSRYEFDGAIRDLTALEDRTPVGKVHERVACEAKDLERARRTFDRTREILADGKHRLSLLSGLSITVTGANDAGFTATTKGAEMKMRWPQLAPPDVRDVAAGGARTAEDWLDVSAFGSVFGLDKETWEEDLLTAYRMDSKVKPEIDRALAYRRGVAIPDGGFVVYDGRWVTPEDKSWLEKGYVHFKGKWLTADQKKRAQGFKKVDGKWLSPRDYARYQKAQKEAEELAAKYMPKGLLDQPGHGAAVPWKKRIEISTRHYRIETDLSRPVAHDLAYTMEILLSNFRSIFGLHGTGATFTVNLVKDRKEYLEHWPRAGRSLGFTTRGAICTYYQPPMTTSVLMHEGTHQILHKFAPSCPRWLHEGLATFFECSQFEFDPKRRRVDLKVGLLNTMRLEGAQAEFRSNRIVPLDKFMEGKGGDIYQEGWAFVYYLAKGKDGQYASHLQDFICVAHKRDVVKRFKRIFHVRDLGEFQKQWKKFIMALDPSKGVRIDAPVR